MKYIFCLTLFVQVAFSQSKTITIIDGATSSPIENVNVYYSNLGEGTFTNSEGRASINVREGDLKITNISYEDLVIKSNDLLSIDTIRMIQKVVVLDEVTISSFDLSESIDFILKNYSKLYVNIPFEKECEFKETLIVNGELRRLIMTKVNWWDQSYERKKNGIILRLGSIEYNKNKSLGIFTDVPRLNVASKSGYITPSSILNTIYLNTLLKSLLPIISEADTKIEVSPSDLILVSFETGWTKSTTFSRHIKGTITFDKQSKAIVQVQYDVDYEGNTVKDTIIENNKDTKSETKRSSLALSFNKTLKNKWSLKTYEGNVALDVTYDNIVNNVVIKNNIFVLKETNVKRVGNKGLIDLTKAIYESLPSSDIKSSNSLLLTEAEHEFMSDFK